MALFRRSSRRPSPEEQSLERSVAALATVVTAGPAASSQRTETSAPYQVVLDVTVGSQPAVRREVTWTVFAAALADVQPGQVLDVKVDPLVPDLVYPPGYPPPGAERGVVDLAACRLLPASVWLEGLLRTVPD